MVKKYAVLYNNIVVNIILLKQEDFDSYTSAAGLDPNNLIELNESTFADIGWQYVDGQFIYVEPPEETQE
jgi:hypothetical protein